MTKVAVVMADSVVPNSVVPDSVMADPVMSDSVVSKSMVSKSMVETETIVQYPRFFSRVETLWSGHWYGTCYCNYHCKEYNLRIKLNSQV